MKRMIICFITFTLMLVGAAEFVLAQDGGTNVVKPEVRVAQYTVRSGDSLWRIVSRYYPGEQVTMGMCRALAGYKNQITHKKLWVFPDQVLQIPHPLVRVQNKINASPTTVSLARAIAESVDKLGKSLQEAQLKADVSDVIGLSILEGLKNSTANHNLKGEMAVTATFGQGVQGWTRINTKKDLSGKSAIVQLDNKYSLRAVYAEKQCNNLYFQLLAGKRMAKLAVLPPPPIAPVFLQVAMRPPGVSPQQLADYLDRYQKFKNRYQIDWDSTWGIFDERFNDGNRVKGWWQTSALYLSVFEDDEGGQWSFGPHITTRRWQGETGDHYWYEGDVDLYGLSGRYRDPERKWEDILRLSWGEREDRGGLANQWGSYDSTQNTDLFNVYASSEYNRPDDNRWFDKIRGSVELEFGYNGERDDYWTDEWNGRQRQHIPAAEKDTYSAAIYTDTFWADPKTKWLGVWNEGRYTYHSESHTHGLAGKIGLNFADGFVKVGIGAFTWSPDASDGWGYYAEISLYKGWTMLFGPWYEEEESDVGSAKFSKPEKQINDQNLWEYLNKNKNLTKNQIEKEVI